MPCALCSDDLSPIVATSKDWIHVLNWNQDFLGKTMIVLRRHADSVEDLEESEWVSLKEQMQKCRRALQEAFAPSNFNYMILMNQDKHVHMHVIPRYDAPKEFGESLFEDLGMPGSVAPNRVSNELLARIATTLKGNF